MSCARLDRPDRPVVEFTLCGVTIEHVEFFFPLMPTRPIDAWSFTPDTDDEWKQWLAQPENQLIYMADASRAPDDFRSRASQGKR
jgi:hypothetical protein